MRVGLDLDGVIYKWDATARYMLKLYHEYDLPESDCWDSIKHSISPQAWAWLWAEAIELGLFRHGHIYKGAVEGVKQLCDVADVAIITSRPKGAMVDTLQWLAFHRFPIAELHIIGATPKSAVAPQCDVYIDDAAHNAEDLHDNTGAKVLLWDRPWNRDWQEADRERVKRVFSWPDVIEEVKETVA